MERLVQIIDSVENQIDTFQLTNERWPLDRLIGEFCQLYPERVRSGQNVLSQDFDWRGLSGAFTDFIEQRGAVSVQIPSIDCPSYPDD